MNYIEQDIEEAIDSFLKIIKSPKTNIISISFIVNGLNLDDYVFFKDKKLQNEKQTFFHPQGLITYSYTYINFFLDISQADIRFENRKLLFVGDQQRYEIDATRIQRLFPGKTPWFGKSNMSSILLHGKRVD